ncbi:MAG: MmcQ/YjbR family DNA-binding protein [Deltaproteobacteria bacterium]|nr:MmcQ/YjbR family DNA-binding protein [Deltaproteobacteria bacterium]
MPGTTEDVKWGNDLCFCIGAKMYLVVGLEGGKSTSLKVPEPVFDELVSRPGIIPAPYLARNKWISFQGTEALSREEIAGLVRGSYRLIAMKLPKKLQRSLGVPVDARSTGIPA